MFLDLQEALSNQWIRLDESVKNRIKSAILTTLGAAAPDVRHTAALVIAKVAAIEIPKAAGPDIVPELLMYASNTSSSTGLRHATLEALGYICEELGVFEQDFLQQDQVNAILTAVVASMRPDEDDMDLRLAATTALNNALEFAHTNFENENERSYIMQMVCHGTQASDSRVRQAAWECLVRIAGFYYATLPSYMKDIFFLSQKAVHDEEENVALQALEFWSTIAEEEVALAEAKANGEVFHGFVNTAIPQLVPMLLEQLAKQEEGAEGDDGAWNAALAAGTALGLAAAAVGDPIVELVMPFVQENIQQAARPDDWRRREAATFAFGSILEGPQVGTLAQLARSGMSFLLAALKDAHPQVRNTTAWTLGRIFEFVACEDLEPPLLGPQNLPQVISALLEAIRDEPHIAEKVCYALSQLAGSFRDADPSPMSAYFKDIVGALLETASRQVDAGAALRLQMQAFEAVNEVVRASGVDAAPLVAHLVPVAVTKLAEATATQPNTPEVADRQSELQGLLCGVVQVTMQKLTDGGDATRQLAAVQADSVMQVLLRVLTWRTDSINEEAMLAVGALTYTCGRGFATYLDAFFPILERGLRSPADWQACMVCVQVLGDVCRAVEDQIAPYCDRLMIALLHNLQDDSVHRAVKPQILSSFGDVAMAIGDRFESYLPHVAPVLQGAAGMCMEMAGRTQAGDEDQVDYINSLRQGILDAWTGIINGMSKAKVDQHLRPYTLGLIEFAEGVIAGTVESNTGLRRTVAALLGDVASSVSGVGAIFQQKPFARQFLQYCVHVPEISDTARWALQMVSAAETAGANSMPVLQTA